ncbi:ferredoxin domain-containing protein [Geoglobus sp.]
MLDENLRREIAVLSGKLMALTAQTAPKSRGEDDVEIVLIEGEEKERLAQKMVEMANEPNRDANFVRDGESVKKADAVLLIGVYGRKPIRVGCGACGFKNCKEFEKAERKKGKDFVGPNCAFKLIDLGIAIGSAVKLGSMLGADSRVMYRIGAAAKELGMARSDVVMGIPIAVTGKNPFFDR